MTILDERRRNHEETHYFE